PEVMEWCDENDIDFVFGLPGNAVLDRLVDQTADNIRTRRALDQKPCLRGLAETSYQAKSWSTDRRACARIEATTKGLDIRFVVTSLETGSAEHVYETLYCARGQAENLIKLHKAQLLPTAPAAAARSPTRCGSSCTPPPTGSCSPSVMPFPGRTRSPSLSSPPFACGF